VTRLSGTSLIIQLLEFFGTIKRGFDSDGVPVIYGKIKVLDGFIYALAATQDVLGKRLDALVLMVLDKVCMMMPGLLLWWQVLSVFLT
jgi:hypothetical protein